MKRIKRVKTAYYTTAPDGTIRRVVQDKKGNRYFYDPGVIEPEDLEDDRVEYWRWLISLGRADKKPSR